MGKRGALAGNVGRRVESPFSGSTFHPVSIANGGSGGLADSPPSAKPGALGQDARWICVVITVPGGRPVRDKMAVGCESGLRPERGSAPHRVCGAGVQAILSMGYPTEKDEQRSRRA